MHKLFTSILALVVAGSLIFASAQTALRYQAWADRNGNGQIDLEDKATAEAYYQANMGAIKRTPRPTAAVPTATTPPVATAIPTQVPTAVPTLVPTAIPTLEPTALPTMPPVATATPTGTAIPVAGQECPAWVHDSYVVAWEDGHTYPTWHPAVDPTYGCFFAHEHGDDPRTSNLYDGKMPPFGLATHYTNGEIHEGHGSEPHPGHKVFVANNGDINDENNVSVGDSMFVVHMGTSGIQRRDTRFHSAEFRVSLPDGRKAHTFLMLDTGLPGNICQRDVSLSDSDPSNNIGRTLAIEGFPGCPISNQYEIWGGSQTIKIDPQYFIDVEMGGSFATFNTATYFTSDLSAIYPSGDTGCRKEAYHEGMNWRIYEPFEGYILTDAYGNRLPEGAHGIRQYIKSPSYKIGATRSIKPGSLNIFKKISDTCNPNLRLPN
jgi:hypothetical protein